MATKNETVEISYKANINQLVEKLKTIPNVTAAEAKKMATALDRQLKQTERAAKRASDASKKAAKSASKAAKKGTKDFDKFAKSAGMAAGMFVAMGVGVIAFGQKIADLTNELSDASTKTGITIETLAGLRLAAEGSGLEFSKLESGLVRFSKSMVDSETGSKKLKQAFSALKVDVKDNDKNFRSTNDTFNDVIKSLSQMEAGAERNAIVMEIFGRTAGPGLIQSGALDNLTAMTEMAKEFGVAINEGGVDAMAKFQRAMAEFDLVSEGTMAKLLNAISGSSGGLASGIQKASSAIVFFGSITEGVLDKLRNGFEGVILQFMAFKKLTEGDFKGAALLSIKGTAKALESAVAYVHILGDANDAVTRFNELSATTRNTQKEIAGTLKEELETETKIEDKKKARAKAEKEALEALKLQQKILAAEETLMRKIEDSLLSSAKIRGDSASDDLARLEQKLELEYAAIDRKLADELASIAKLEQAAENSWQADIAREEAKTDSIQKLKDLELDTLEEIEEIKKKFFEDELKRKKENRAETIAGFSLSLDGLMAFSSASIQALEDTGSKNKELIAGMFVLNKGLALANVGFKTAEAVVAAQVLPPPFNFIAAGAAIATGAAQTASIASQKPPSFHMGGLVPGETSATLLGGEAVLDRSTVDRLGGEDGVRELQNNQSNSLSEITVNFPYKHLGRYQRDMNRQRPIRAGSGRF